METTPDISQYLFSDMAEGEVRRLEKSTSNGKTICPFCETNTRGLVVIRKWYGWFVYCHWCNQGRTVTEKGLSLSTIKKMISRRLSAKQEQDDAHLHQVETVKLPSDFTTDIPELGMRWLRTYRVTDDEIRKYRFGFSPLYDRLIMPVYGDEGVKYWQGRRLNDDKTQPKYLNFTSSRTEVFFVVDNKHPVTVIVEDILSALAVARSGYNTIALLGSHANDSVCSWIPGSTQIVKVWLDPDMRKKATKLAKRLRAFGYKTSAILLAVKDPKEYQGQDVKHFIEGGILQ